MKLPSDLTGLFWAQGAKNFKITGGGIADGAGSAWNLDGDRPAPLNKGGFYIGPQRGFWTRIIGKVSKQPNQCVKKLFRA